MAIIQITLDTAQGDTLQNVVDAILADLSPPETQVEKTIVANGFGDVGSPIRTVTLRDKPTPAEVAVSGAIVAMDGDRKRGEPGEGHRRRTNKQIQEDDLFFAQSKARAEAAIAVMEAGVEKFGTPAQLEPVGPENIGDVTIAKDAAERAAAILRGAARRTEDADAAQDAADEAAESAKRTAPEPTLMDLKKTVGDYQKKFGMPQASKRIPEMLGMPVIEVPSKDFSAMIHKIRAAIEHDKPQTAEPLELETPPSPPATTATVEEYNEIVCQYGDKFDGSRDSTKMVFSRIDIPKILDRLFGKMKWDDIGRSPQNFGRAYAAVRAEIEHNTLGRKPK